MDKQTMTEKLSFVVTRRHQDEATLLALAVRAGIDALYRETMTEAYLMGEVPREAAAQALGQEQLEDLEYQRDCLRRDVEWGMQGV